MKLIVHTTQDIKNRSYAMYESQWRLVNHPGALSHVLIKTPCVGCGDDILRNFTESSILDCQYIELNSLYDGLICRSCLKYMEKQTPASIVDFWIQVYKEQDKWRLESIPLYAVRESARLIYYNNMKKQIIANLTQYEKIRQYIEKMAECQLWDQAQKEA